MKRVQSYLRSFLCSGFLLILSTAAFANHLVGMDFFYTYVTGNTYKITLIAYGDCGSAATSAAFSLLPTDAPSVYIYNGSTYVSTVILSIEPPSTGVEITPVCPADIALTQCTDLSYTIPGIKKFVYSTTYTVSGASAYWRFLFTGDLASGTSIAGRALTITNIPPGSTIQLVDTLPTPVSHNSNPVLNKHPHPVFLPRQSRITITPAAVDPDGDSLSFFLGTRPGWDSDQYARWPGFLRTTLYGNRSACSNIICIRPAYRTNRFLSKCASTVACCLQYRGVSQRHTQRYQST